MWCLKAIIRSFELVSGLRVNFSKSNVVGINIEERVLRSISQFFVYNIGFVPFKFLGVLVGVNPRRVSTWQPILDVIKARLTNWKSWQLSIGGRTTLINSVHSSLPLYFFSLFTKHLKSVGRDCNVAKAFSLGR